MTQSHPAPKVQTDSKLEAESNARERTNRLPVDPPPDDSPQDGSPAGIAAKPRGENLSQPLARDGESIFHIVGVGASAGGLEALETFFANIPDDTGMAFVVVQHLSPDFKSVMDELLARHTQLPIHRVTDGMTVEPNAVYLIPPKKEMIISGGKLLLSDKDPEQGVTLPIDIFFRSLAQDVGARSVGIVLSGTGSDGSRGICDIHNAGGLVLAQSEESSKFDGMPKSALETGIVDVVLPPSAMPTALVAYASGELSEMMAADKVSLVGLDAIFNLLRRDYGIDFSHYKRTTVTRRVQRRLLMSQVVDLDEYVERLRRDPAELNSLYKDLLIGVTKFFRDADAFESLETEVLPQLIARTREDHELRIWVAGCATGEEAYSLAILIHEQIQQAKTQLKVKIFATDVHPTSLETASNGVYSEASLSEVSPERLERYFKRDAAGFHVTSELRQMIVFAPHNVIKDAPFTKLDLITCRNLLIYFEQLAQKKALSLFHFGLSTGGFMMLGPSESPGELADEFEVIDEHWKIYRKRRDRRFPADVRLPLSLGYSPNRPPGGMVIRPQIRSAPDATLMRAYDSLLADHAPPSLLINERRELVQAFSGGSKFLQLRDGRLTTDVLELIDSDLRLALSTALQQAIVKQTSVVFKGVPVRVDGVEKTLKLTVKPLPDTYSDTDYLLISFESFEVPKASDSPEGSEIDMGQASQERLQSLETELRYTKENLQATIEELETSNEELQATNEELVASNEELQSTNEELHSVNEELYTVNAEYQKKIGELTELTADIDNLLYSTDVGVIFLDRDLCIRKFTPRIAQTFHLLSQDIGRRIDSFAHGIDRPSLLDDVAHVLETETRLETEVLDRNGNAFFLRILPYRSKGRVEGVVLTLIDISALARAQHELSLMSKVFEDGADPIIIEDLRGKIINVNMEAGRVYGWPREELINNTIDLIVPPEELLRAKELRQRCREKGGVRNIETLSVTRSGEVHPVLLTLSLLTDASGQPNALVSMSKDITDRKHAEEKAKEAVRRRDQLLAMLSHELRNPLGAILNATYVVNLVKNIPSELGDATGVIQRQALQMARLLDDLLDVSRVTQGKIEMRKEILDACTLISDAVQAVRPVIDSHGHELILDVAAGPLCVEGDASRLLQVLENLLNNAAKYTQPRGKIWLTLKKEDDEIVLRVRDSGQGIPQDMLDAIFELFVQAENTLDRSAGGMGVGLTLVRTLVHLHGGKVTAHSEGINQGSEFIVRLPLSARAPEPRDPPPPGPWRAADTRIVIVEDNFDSRTMLEALLRLDGYQVAVAEEGHQGLELILHQRPDIALVDIGLPGLDGYQIARRVREEIRGTDMRLIALTGYGQAEDRKAVKDAGFDAHLVKPLKPEELAQILALYPTSRLGAK